MSTNVDAIWFPRSSEEEPGAFIPVVRGWMQELCKLDTRFCYLGRRMKRSENGAELPLDVLERSFKRGQNILSLASVHSPLDTGLHISAGPGHTRAKIRGRVFISTSDTMAQESSLLHQCLQVSIQCFKPDEAYIWASNTEGSRELGIPVWLCWKRDAAAPSPAPHFKPRGTPSQIEPWLGGTLYTWPEFEPRKLIAQASEGPV